LHTGKTGSGNFGQATGTGKKFRKERKYPEKKKASQTVVNDLNRQGLQERNFVKGGKDSLKVQPEDG